MARLQSVVVGGGFRGRWHNTVVDELPATLKKLVLGWKANTPFSNTTPRSHITDEQMRNFLERSFRHDFDPSVEGLLSKAPNLQIYLDTVIGKKVCHLDLRAPISTSPC